MENSMTKRNSMQALAVLAIPVALLMLSIPAQADPFQGGGNGGQNFGPPPQATGRMQQGGPDGQGGMRQGHHSQLMQQLGLSQEQSQKIKAMMQQGRSQGQALHQQLKTKRQALMQYLQSPDATESKARALNGEINDIQRQLSELRLKTWFGMRAQLTPEQLQKLGQMKAQFGGGPEGNRRFGGQNGRMMQQRGQYGPGGGNGNSFGHGPDAGFAPQGPGFGNSPEFGQPMGGPRIGAARPLGPDAEMQNGPMPEDGPLPMDSNDEGPPGPDM
jgi:Spy/CpxP family protein refolding chaperone